MQTDRIFLYCFIVTLSSAAASGCAGSHEQFKIEERAYDSVVNVKVASQERKAIIKRFIKLANVMLTECKQTISLDRQYTLRRKVNKAEIIKSELNVMTLNQLRAYAVQNPEKRVIYTNGTIILH